MNNLQQALAGVKLKKSKIENDSSGPKLDFKSEQKAAEDLKKYQATVLDINLEHWIKLIPEYTFKTEMMELTTDHGKLFISNYKEYESYRKNKVIKGERDDGYDFKPNTKIQKDIDELSSNFQKVVDLVREGDSGCVFVKTSCRSAKDAPANQKNLVKYYANFLAQADDNSDHSKIMCMLKAGLEVMKVRTAEEAVELLLRSERVAEDMSLALDAHSKNPGTWFQNLIARQWRDIDIDMEFRGFVHKGKLNALSQYNYICFFPRLVDMKDKICQVIRTFFDTKIQEKLSTTFDSYIIDFALLGDYPYEIMVIELNPFLCSTDGCLFSWKKEREIIENGPFEFRINTKIPHGGKTMISSDWRRLMEETESKITPAAITMPSIPSATTSRQTVLINLPLDTVWKLIRSCTFEWQKKSC